ncbi:hypothetical protein ABB37_00482 [Leptomonas pyrrhocoris]|uniref:Uncharacterized protein n=1 Tax=Leptomonas pyrrhocoris TaxID=157538 RepID=A0A0M9GAM9_LEPPY|nr:hypothetical protein ABB37_00482 [Leptomonas pyrrhocoris]KPA86249.1 hypothetical protein ABB37_00482 [Leptomonas pyrrhocoris]|eukprot:XP_015664688.1 hypothetical protein ABB37_00482 [Leptomonas pyrrhocoris]
MDSAISPPPEQWQGQGGDDDDHVSPSLEQEEEHSRQPPPLPSSVDETEASLLPAFSPAFTVEDSDICARVTNAAVEDSDVVLVYETVQLSSHDAALDAVAASEPVLLGGGETSQDLLLAPRMAGATPSSNANLLDTEGEVVVVMTGNEDAGGDDADGTRGAAIQDKYSATSQWVESLPLTATPSLADEANAAVDDASGAVVRSRRGKRVRDVNDALPSTSDMSVGGGTLRQRRAHEKAAEAELQIAFQHSQRALRKQAKSVNMRDVFSRSTTLPSPLPLSNVNANSSSAFPASPLIADGSSNSVRTAGGGVFSPLSFSSFRFGTSVISPAGATSPTTPSSSSAWSPCVVGELTNQFLANVQHQRRQKFEQFVSRELTQSQTLSQTRSFHPHPHGEDREEEILHRQTAGQGGETAATNGFSAPVDELVIGDDDNEAANWMPAEVASPALLHGRRVGHDRHANDEVVLLGASSVGEEGRYTTSPSTSASDICQAEDAVSQQQQQQQVVQSLARKHEIWKLKQRQLKAQQQVELDERAKTKQQQSSAASSSKLLTAASSLTISSTSHTHTGEVGTGKEVAFGGASLSSSATATYQSFFRTSQITSPSTVTSRTQHKTNLSADAISMIRRINSFDNTSTKRVVVFGTAASAKQAKEEDTQ